MILWIKYFRIAIKEFMFIFNKARHVTLPVIHDCLSFRHVTQDIKGIIQNGKLGEDVSIDGWVKFVRKHKERWFIEMNDGSSSTNLQVILDTNFQLLEKDLNPGSCIAVVGKLIEASGRKQEKELHAQEIKITGQCDQTYPIQKQGLPLEYLRDHLHLRSRTNMFSALLRVRNQTTLSIHQFFQGFYQHSHTNINIQ